MNKNVLYVIILSLFVLLGYSLFKYDKLDVQVNEYENREKSREMIISLYELEISKLELLNDSLFNINSKLENNTDSTLLNIINLTEVSITNDKIKEALKWVESQSH